MGDICFYFKGDIKKAIEDKENLEAKLHSRNGKLCKLLREKERERERFSFDEHK